MRVLGNLGRLVVMGLFASCVAVTACGGGAAEAPTAASAPTPTAPEVTALKCKLGHSQSGKVDMALQAALIAAGYTLTDGGDAVIEFEPTVVAKPAPVIIVVNGQQKLDITVTLNAKANGQLVDQVTTEFTAMEADVSADHVKPIVSALNQHGKLASYARDQQAKASAAEETAWKDSGADDCTTPKSAKACQKLDSWLQGHGTSKHADEARKILKDSEAKLAALEDDQAWTGAHADQCQAPKQSNDCSGVQNYVTSYPSGGHVSEAKQMLQAAAAKIAKLKSAESAAQKAQDLADCQKGCKQDTCQWLMGSSRYQVCVNNCYSACQ